MSAPAERLGYGVEGRTAIRKPTVWSATRFLAPISQLVLAAVVVHVYRIEGPAFLRLFMLAVAGFAVNVWLPLRYRLQFFVLLSLAGVFVVFGIADGVWLIACGLILIGLCHVPIPFRFVVLSIAAVAATLAVARGGLIRAPWSSAVWPILGSMFMFRLVLYMLATRTPQADSGPWGALAYFFMLPNLAFPLFPVIDYQTFRRTYYDRSDDEIYAQGGQWIARGLVHLVLYRFVYYNVLTGPTDVVRLGDLVQFMLGTFLLYLRVSGQFHLIVGLLHLFGFRLPETHKLYYLAHSFTELWRRINIYWTDFMMKLVFYPTYFAVKRRGSTVALGLATCAVFVTTWVLHSYQWFWLRGGFPITLQDVLFWGFLGGLVTSGALRELKAGRKSGRGGAWSWRLGLRSAATFSLFCFLWSLWSAESVGQWLWMLGAATNVDLKGVVLLVLTFATVAILGGRHWEGVPTSRPRWLTLTLAPATRSVVPLVVLLALAQPSLRGVAPVPLAAGLSSLQRTGLNARDAALQHRGYYEQLDVRGRPDERAAEVIGKRLAGWQDPAGAGILRDRNDILLRDLYPSRRVIWNGNTFSTNRWGMRDREYSREKRDDTLRIALLGPSHVMGNGVSDGETFESLIEDRLNREHNHGKYRHFEILNFGVDGYTQTQQVAILEDRVFDFSPDIVIDTQYHRVRDMTEGYLLKIAWGDVAVPLEPLQALLQRGGVAALDRGDVPVPFATARSLSRRLGLRPRMPYSESASRIRWIADDVVEWSLHRFSEVTAAHGVVPLVLALNAVIDDAPREIPNRKAIQAAGLPVVDLFNVYPDADRPALRVAPWDDHPNAAGHRLIADRLYPALVAFIESGALERRPARTPGHSN